MNPEQDRLDVEKAIDDSVEDLANCIESQIFDPKLLRMVLKAKLTDMVAIGETYAQKTNANKQNS